MSALFCCRGPWVVPENRTGQLKRLPRTDGALGASAGARTEPNWALGGRPWREEKQWCRFARIPTIPTHPNISQLSQRSLKKWLVPFLRFRSLKFRAATARNQISIDILGPDGDHDGSLKETSFPWAFSLTSVRKVWHLRSQRDKVPPLVPSRSMPSASQSKRPCKVWKIQNE